MQFNFSTVAVFLAAIASTTAAPGGAAVVARAEIQARTCGTLTGTALTVCQDACKAVCDAGTAGIARKLCADACDAGPLKMRSSEDDSEGEVEERSILKSACDAACDVTCNSTVLALDQLACLNKCKGLC